MNPKLPNARNEAVAVQELEKETLIYDFEIDKAYCLNETSTIVYRHCDGKTSFEELKRRYKYTEDLIYLALDELQTNNLVKSDKITHFTGMSRREAIKKVGLGTLVALPLISFIAAPSAANAASAACIALNEFNCTYNNFTQSDCCANLRCENPGFTSCVACRNPGVGFFPAGAGFSVAACNARPEKNRCCNPTGDAGYDGTSCNCPTVAP